MTTFDETTPTAATGSGARHTPLPPASRALVDLLELVRSTRSRGVIPLLLAVAATPLTFVEATLIGPRLSGWAWLVVLAVLAPVALTEPLVRAAVRRLWPYLAFLGLATISLTWSEAFRLSQGKNLQVLLQLAIPVLAYLVAWSVPYTLQLQRAIRTVAFAAIALAAVLTVATGGGTRTLVAFGLSERPMAVALASLFVVASINAPTSTWVFYLGCLVAGLSIGTGSRMASAVILILLLTNRSLRIGMKTRLLLLAAMLALVGALSTTSAFQDRFFFHENVSFMDAITLSDSVNTSGRRELWPILTQHCANHPFGLGIGSASGLSVALTNGILDHPHNDYLRTYCEVGWPGTIVFWGFFAFAIVRSVRASRAARDGPRAELHAGAAQLVLTLLLFAITDNPIVYTVHVMVPLMMVLAFSDRALHDQALARANGSTTARRG